MSLSKVFLELLVNESTMLVEVFKNSYWLRGQAMGLRYRLEMDEYFVRPLQPGEPIEGEGKGFFRADGYFYCEDPQLDPFAEQVENRDEMMAEMQRRLGNWTALII